ncbi:hypothetical protein [Erythrobacter aureus]|nr:hypothetical protein [Erythrobacter aureus]
MAGAALVMAAAQPLAAQSNPFLPAAGASKAEVERIVEAKVKAMAAEGAIGSAAPAGAAPPVAGAPGVAGVPCPPGVPGAGATPGPGAPVNEMSGACVPGGMMPPGAFGAEGVQMPLGAVEGKLAEGARFIGCINGVPKFALKNGTRLTFTKAEVSKGVEAGVIPACR